MLYYLYLYITVYICIITHEQERSSAVNVSTRPRYMGKQCSKRRVIKEEVGTLTATCPSGFQLVN